MSQPDDSHSSGSDAAHGAGGFVSPWVQLRSASASPLLFEKMIRTIDAAARDGDVVSVYDKAAHYFGRGLLNRRSQIVLRMLTQDDVPVDEAFWRARLSSAIALRRQLALDDVTDAYRLVHAEGDGLSGLIVERYADWLVFEVFSLGMQQRAGLLARLCAEELGSPTRLERPGDAASQWGVWVRADEHIAQREGFRLTEQTPPGGLTIREHGIRYRIDVAGGHKTGFFCDQRDNRLALARLCRDARVLDVCCHSGGFALCARKLGAAREVTGVDLDEQALVLAKANANLNQCRIDFVHADAFIYLRQMLANQRQFDVVVLDPPKFAPTRDDLQTAEAKYHDLNKLGMQAVRPGGVLLTCSCSGLVSPAMFLDVLRRAARGARRNVQVLAQSGAGADHPVHMNHPESAYLKAFWLRVA